MNSKSAHARLQVSTIAVLICPTLVTMRHIDRQRLTSYVDSSAAGIKIAKTSLTKKLIQTTIS